MQNNKNSVVTLECNIKQTLEMDDQCVEPSSGPSSIIYSGDNEEEYLRATFARLGVGLDGFLSLEELTKVCHAIGMDKLTSEVIDQLFCRLDVDGDGRISFEEFLLMFQIGGPDTSQSLILDDSLNQDSSLVTSSSCLPSVGNTGMLVTEFGIFSSLDPDGSGYVSVSRLVDAWYSLGLRESEKLLKDLGLPYKRDEKVSLRDFGGIMEEELRLQQDSSSMSRQATILTLLHEIKSLRVSLETARGERDKFRWDLGEANHRIGLFAQELDEQNAAMEKITQKQLSELERQYKEQLRELQETLHRERENGRDTALCDSQELITLNSHLQEEESRLKSRVVALEKDVKKLEVENLELSSKLSESVSHSQTAEKHIHELKKLRDKVAEYESLSPREEEFRKLILKIEELVTENQKLRDSNDELIAQVDAYTNRNTVGRLEDYSLEGSCIGDYLNDSSSSEGTIGGVKRRGGTSPIRENSAEDGSVFDGIRSPRESKIRRKSSNGQFQLHYLGISTNDELVNRNLSDTPPFGFITSSGSPVSSGQPSSLPDYLPPRTAGKEQAKYAPKSEIHCSLKSDLQTNLYSPSMRSSPIQFRSTIRFRQKNRMQILTGHCQELEEELSQLKSKVIQLVEEKKQLQIEHEKYVTRSSSSLDSMIQGLYSYFEESLLRFKRKRTRSFTTSISDVNSPQSSLHGGRDVIPTILEEEEDEFDEESDKVSGKTKMKDSGVSFENIIKLEIEKFEKEVASLEECWNKERDLLEKQKALAQDTLNKMEQEYQALKSDYEKSEDYWQMKFQEEVDYYEEERKLYDEKFLALELKIKEYEEVALSSTGSSIEASVPSEIIGEGFSDDSVDRLSTIDESAVWERQVTELEDEVKCLQKKLREAVEEKENSDLSWNQKLSSEHSKYLQEINHLRNELEHTRSLFHTLQIQFKCAKEDEKTYFTASMNVPQHNDIEKSCYNIKNKEGILDLQDRAPDQRNYLTTRDESTSDSCESALNGSLKAQLNLLQKRNEQLEHLLKISQKCSGEIINQTNERHNVEIQSLQSMITSSQHLFTSNLTKYREQLSKVLRGDMLVRELYLENAQLMLALQITEERQKEAEQQIRKLQLATQMASVSHEKL
ncbi:UNVERIFIED_CONTAM: hypothetical protein RMT77_007001 [Armadillidium vulgare]